uniref:Major facilitator superfamily (MFS) profile domain-containing protein n=1 Tax=Strigamia maritima TaxID=126957 RepID=T1IXG4_STRMM
MAVRNVDELLKKYGGDPGRYQIFVLCLLCFCLWSSALNDMMNLFIITAHPHHCKIPDNSSKSEYIPKLENDEYDSCLMYINPSDHELGTTECTSAVEIVQPHRRTMIGIVGQCIWPCMLLLLSGLFYFFKSWKTVHLICNLPFVVTITYIWLIPESTRWLLAVGKVSRAKMELLKLCRLNKLPLDAKFEDDVKSIVQEIHKNKTQTKQNYGFMDLIRKKKMRIISFISFYYYFVALFAFYGILFAMTGFNVNIYVSFAAISFIELLAGIILYFIMLRTGRKITTLFSLAICAALCIVVATLQITLPDGKVSEMGVTIAASIGLVAIAAFFSCMPIYCNELSPTVLRNLLYGVGNFWGQIGSMVAPQVMLLEIYVWKPLPFVICALMCSLGAILTHLLPETKNKPLPEIPEDVHTLWSSTSEQSIPDNISINESIPKLNTDKYDSCHMYINASEHKLGTTECTSGWQFYAPNDEWNIVQEWDLVCGKHYQAALATTLYFAGVTVGAAFFGYLADMVGRKPVMIGSILLSLIITSIIPFSVNFLMYVILKVFHGFLIQGGFNCAYIVGVELFMPHRRTMVAIVSQTLWPCMLFLMCGLFYFFKSWKTVHLISNIPFVLIVTYIWLVPESIRWLLAVGKVTRAKMELTRICRFNKLPIEAEFADDVQNVVEKINQNKKQTKKTYVLKTLTNINHKANIISIIFPPFSFVAMFMFYGISFAMTGFKVNVYVIFMVTSSIELLAIFFMYFIMLRIGRKTAIKFSLGTTCTLCILVAVFQLTLPEGVASEMGVTIVAAIGRAALAAFFSSMPIYGNELSPTVLRNLLFGISNFWGRIGAMVAPQVMLLEQNGAAKSHWMGSTSVDDLLANFGDPGRCQKYILAMLCVSLWIISLNNLMTIFNMGISPHHCQISDGISLNDSIPRLDNGEYESCSMYINFDDHSAGTTDCTHGWTHYPQDGKWTIIQEWDLVCDKHYQAALANSVYFAGVTIGCGLFGYLADRIGRRPVILSCLYGYVAVGIGIAFANNYYVYLILRFLGGLILQGASGTAYVMSIELFLPHRRNIVAIIAQMQWPMMLLLVTILDYFIKNWRTFHLIISVPFTLTISFTWLLPECPRWLIATNKVEQAKKELKRFAQINHLPIPPNLGAEITHVIECNQQTRRNQQKHYGILDLFRTRNMFIVSLASCYFFFTGCFAFYAIAYSMTTIGSNVHLSYCITSLIDLAVIGASYFILNSTTRKTMLYAVISSNALICTLVLLLLIILPPGNEALLCITITAGLGRAVLSAYFSVMPVHISELSPTVIRTLLLGVANLWGRIGGIVAPQVMLLKGKKQSKLWINHSLLNFCVRHQWDKMVATLDNFINRLGDPGRYQVFALLLLATNGFPGALNPALITIFATTPPHHCKISNNSSFSINDTIPLNSNSKLDNCNVYINPANKKAGLSSCNGEWDYNTDAKSATIVAEWNLVCNHRHLARLAQTFYFVGVAIGGPIAGFLADKFGRKPVMLVSLLLQTIIGIGIVFSNTYQAYIALRTIQGFLIQALVISTYCLIFENFSQKFRTNVAILVTSTASSAIIVAALIAYAVNSWRYTQLALSLPSLVGIAYFWLAPESVRWLICNKKLEEAENVAEFYASHNNVSLPPTLPHEIDWISRQLPVSCKGEWRNDPRHLVKTPKLRKYLLIQSYSWFATALASSGVTYLIPDLGGSVYFTFIAIGGVSVSSRLLLFFILPKLGRRILQCVSCVVIGVLYFATSLLYNYSDGNAGVTAASVGCALFAIAFISASMACLDVYTAELYPTLIRGAGSGVCGFWHGFGHILAPFLLLLGERSWLPFPALFIGIVTIVAGLLTLLLPETQQIPLPDTVEDSENIETIYSTKPRLLKMSNPQPNLLDKLLLSLGSPGRFQVILFILLCTNAYPITFNFIFITWFRTIPPHHCKIPLNDASTYQSGPCHMYNNKTEQTEDCINGYTYSDGYDHTIASEWDLVCDKMNLNTIAATIFFGGVMIGGLIFGTLADKFGRKPVVLATLYGQAILGVIIAFSPNFIVFVILKFIQGALLQGLQSTNNSLVMEMFPLRYRTIAGMILAMCATSGHMMLAGFFYLIPNWKWMQLTISLLTITTISYTWLFPESIRWQLSQNKQKEALNSVKRIAKCNNIILAPDIPQQLADISDDIIVKSTSVIKYDIRDLFRTKQIRQCTLSLLFCWFSAAVTYYGIQFYVPKMTQRYWSLFVGGASETVARLVGYFIIDYLGRRKPLIFFYSMSGLLCIAAGMVNHFAENLILVSNILAILGKLCSAQCFAFNGIYASEIFPTVIRTIGLGVVACFARIGAMVAPQILELKDHFAIWVPFIIFGSLSIISAIFIFFLPETLNVPLPNTVEDVETNINTAEAEAINKAPTSDNDIRNGGIDNPTIGQTLVDEEKDKVNSVTNHKEINESPVNEIEDERL